jgi:hypothetical protein
MDDAEARAEVERLRAHVAALVEAARFYIGHMELQQNARHEEHRGANGCEAERRLMALLDAPDLAALVARAEKEQAVIAAAVPMNWCDPLLTGPDGIGQPPYDCRHIEKLLHGIKARLATLDTKEP